MPNRIIRDAINRSPRVDLLDAHEEVFYRRLLNEVDDYGRREALPLLVRADLFPLRVDRVREADLVRWIAACEKANLIRLYEVAGADCSRWITLQCNGVKAGSVALGSNTYILLLSVKDKPRAESSKHPEPPADFTEC